MLQGVVDPNKTERAVRCVSRMLTLRQNGFGRNRQRQNRMYSWFAGFRLNVAQEDEQVVIVMLDVPDWAHTHP